MAIIIIISIMILSFGLGIFGFLLQTVVHIINGLVHFGGQILVIGLIIYGIYRFKDKF